MNEKSKSSGALGERARLVRLVLVALVLVVTILGTLWGDDDHFPFGPFRMYSIANELDGEVRVVTFSADTAAGERIDMRPEAFGLRPAEVEGQMDRLVGEPGALGGLIEAYEELGGKHSLVALHLIEQAHQLENGRPVDIDERVIATWTRP